ncbi:MAG TPA: AmmeMemoRadiSam system radical SAM enzyme [Dehalococcoidia bacterium]|nr:AmmeMemoRadiSam system radical SAM enzyme [Dehalococcoidia bacterium]
MPRLAGKAIPLSERIDALTREGELYERLSGNKVRCYACGHRCLVPDGQRGICQVRFNRGGTLMVPHGYVGALQCDPTEKKPLFHVLPGSRALTFGMLGCDYHCGYCQNWLTSQALRDPAAGIAPDEVSAGGLVAMARELEAAVIASSYNEPLITSEWAIEVFRLARPQGFVTAYVSNGNATREVLEYLRPWLDCYKIDLKSMSAKSYRALGGKLQNVLETVSMVYEMGFWMEIVTLLVPGFNDSDEEVREAARFLAGVSPDIPWHVTAFHKDYKMTDPDDAGPRTLLRAAEIGREEGLRFVYCGNLPGLVGDNENTVCPGCSRTLIGRYGYTILDYALTAEGRCPDCGASVPGVWSPPAA